MKSYSIWKRKGRYFSMFEKFMDKAISLAEVGVNKAKEVGEVAKLNLNIVSEEENIKKAYIEIGKLYYAGNSLNPDPAYAEFCKKIGESKVKIELNKTKIAEIKADDDDKNTNCSCCCVDVEVPPEESDEPKE